MATYIKERSFVASLKSIQSGYLADFDFSRLIKETYTIPAGVSISQTETYIGSDEYDYLTATTKPREELNFWFLCRRWDNGSESYEIKVRHDMFFENPSRMGSLITEDKRVLFGPLGDVRFVTLHVRPGKSLASNPGWKVLIAGRPLSASDIQKAEVGPVQILAPNGNPLGVYDKQSFGDQWWAYISCARENEQLLPMATRPVQIMMKISQYQMNDPLS
ncbi:hypothetical protein Q1J52_23335 [Pseudomonas lijiangensis]|uniref:Uncharacterized protein n=1 Tax=Pseudomonas cichorii TaxID=36746 RepID=A0A3M4WIZ4_PSECI|nr:MULTISPECIES: hypothetical protein [Pseudomonas]RMR63262.1 hypothetical protein ALP84_04156 [Pseudomonas cichorii]GFM67895.1 hypothetical protein PSCICJ_40130 [Pseudomonas cichorii]GFM79054.1 hypothetical protein PSCICM_48730 [Pseudomonas cichorii]